MASNDRPVLLLVNPSSGSGKTKGLLPRVEGLLRDAGRPFQVVTTRSVEHGREEALKGAEAGKQPTVMSGDGLIGQIGGALADGDTPLAVVPAGRGNDFARTVGIPVEPEEAVAALLEGHSRSIDVGEANGKRFLCIASTGFDSRANQLANEAKLVRGQLVYAYAGIRTLIDWKAARFTVDLDGKTQELSGYSVSAANGTSYGGGMLVAPNADIADGLFDVVTIKDMPKLRFLRGLPRVFKGEHVNDAEVIVNRAAEVKISADRPFAVYADGEHITDLPATLRLLNRALRVIVPAQKP